MISIKPSSEPRFRRRAAGLNFGSGATTPRTLCPVGRPPDELVAVRFLSHRFAAGSSVPADAQIVALRKIYCSLALCFFRTCAALSRLLQKERKSRAGEPDYADQLIAMTRHFRVPQSA
jgi:hypothetical protein